MKLKIISLLFIILAASCSTNAISEQDLQQADNSPIFQKLWQKYEAEQRAKAEEETNRRLLDDKSELRYAFITFGHLVDEHNLRDCYNSDYLEKNPDKIKYCAKKRRMIEVLAGHETADEAANLHKPFGFCLFGLGNTCPAHREMTKAEKHYIETGKFNPEQK